MIMPMSSENPPSSNSGSNTPPFRPPEGYVMRWRQEGRVGKAVSGGFVLIGPDGQELGFFELSRDMKGVTEALKSRLTPEIIGESREEMRAIIVFRDSRGKDIGQWEMGKPAKNEIEEMIKDLASR